MTVRLSDSMTTRMTDKTIERMTDKITDRMTIGRADSEVLIPGLTNGWKVRQSDTRTSATTEKDDVWLDKGSDELAGRFRLPRLDWSSEWTDRD